MDLILWRHADAIDGMPDEERELSASGTRQAAAMARWLRAQLRGDWRVIASPALRTRQTASALTDEFVIDHALSTRTTPEKFLEAVDWEHGEGTVIAVGHQPTLGAVAALILSGKPALWPVKKAAIWWLRREDDQLQVRAVFSPQLLDESPA
ncbi:MAG: SixA phosphatase family protein [Nitrospiraceae bacterium]